MRSKDRVALEARIFLAVAYTPAPVASECSLTRNNPGAPFAATLAEGDRGEAAVEHCFEVG